MGEVTIEELIEELKKDELVGKGKLKQLDDERAKLETPEGYIFVITAEGEEYEGEGEEYAVPPGLIAEEISYTVDPDDEWTKENVTVTISVVKDPYYLQYSLDLKKWEDYTNPIEVQENGTVYLCKRNKLGEQGEIYTSIQINTIDKLAPVKITPEVTTTSSTITVTVADAKDEQGNDKYGESGIEEILYSIDGGESWVTNENKKDVIYEFKKLIQEREYPVQVKIIDKAKNETITEIKPTKTGKVTVAEGNLTINTPTWSELTASTTITKGGKAKENESIQYQINGPTEEGWTDGVNVNGIHHNDTVYARLWDGTNGGDCTSLNVKETEHLFGEWSRIEPNCTQKGSRTHICRRCQESQTETLQELGHTWTNADTTHVAAGATCTTQATYYQKCSRCSTYGGTPFASGSALGHAWTNADTSHVAAGATCTTQATYYQKCSRCSTYGGTPFASGGALGHAWTNADTTHVATGATCTAKATYYQKCSRCSIYGGTPFASGNALGHAWTNADTTHLVTSATCQKRATYQQKCSRCSIYGGTPYESGSLAGHIYNSKTINSTYLKSGATCQSPAVYYYKCQWCTGHGTATYTSGSKSGHVYNRCIVQDRSLSKAMNAESSGGGWYIMAWAKTCQWCNELAPDGTPNGCFTCDDIGGHTLKLSGLGGTCGVATCPACGTPGPHNWYNWVCTRCNYIPKWRWSCKKCGYHLGTFNY